VTRFGKIARFLLGIPAASGKIAAVTELGDDAFQPDLAGVREHLFAVDLKTSLNWIAVFSISYITCVLRAISGSFRRSWPLR
jgi:hypothetical protein